MEAERSGRLGEAFEPEFERFGDSARRERWSFGMTLLLLLLVVPERCWPLVMGETGVESVALPVVGESILCDD